MNTSNFLFLNSSKQSVESPQIPCEELKNVIQLSKNIIENFLFEKKIDEMEMKRNYT